MSNTNTDILLAGAIAAFSVDLLVYPLDTLKTRLQSPEYKRIYVNASTNTANRAVLFRGLYQGVGSVIIATLPSCAGAFFTTYEGVKTLLSRHNPHLRNSSNPLIPQPVIHATASSIAELVSCFILTPAEVLKQNAQMVNQKSSIPSTYSLSNTAYKPTLTAKLVVKENPTFQVLLKFRSNPTHLWRGYTALAARNLPFTAMQFPMFEHLKTSIQIYREPKGQKTGSLLETGLITAVSAGSAGSVAAVITTPIDVVKTRIMLSASDRQSYNNPHSVKELATNGNSSRAETGNVKERTKRDRPTSWAIGREILRSEGAKGLWRGGLLRGLWTALGSGLYLGVYESGRIWLGERRNDRELET